MSTAKKESAGVTYWEDYQNDNPQNEPTEQIDIQLTPEVKEALKIVLEYAEELKQSTDYTAGKFNVFRQSNFTPIVYEEERTDEESGEKATVRKIIAISDLEKPIGFTDRGTARICNTEYNNLLKIPGSKIRMNMNVYEYIQNDTNF